jgi:hypothetical protein
MRSGKTCKEEMLDLEMGRELTEMELEGITGGAGIDPTALSSDQQGASSDPLSSLGMGQLLGLVGNLGSLTGMLGGAGGIGGSGGLGGLI